MLENYVPPYDATVVEKLKAAGAIAVGKTNMDEFAMGSSNENSAFFPTHNPWDLERVPGGSSGGSAAATAAGECIFALGSDTGGSIRQPASFTGILGMKPTYGRVSRHGLIAYASSLDQIGPLSLSAKDMARVMTVIAGKDDFDSTLSDSPNHDFEAEMESLPPSRIAYYKSYLNHKGLDPEIRNRFFGITEKLKELGHEIVETDFEYLEYLVPTYYILTTAEASSNLARYDGIHFGFRSPDADDLNSTYVLSRSQGFGKEVKRRIMLGTYVLSEGYYDAYYTKAQRLRRKIADATNNLLIRNNFILMPTSPHTAFAIGQQTQDPIKMYLEDIFTAQAPLAGNPAISVPAGKHSNGMPFGIQAIGRRFDEGPLLALAKLLMNIE